MPTKFQLLLLLSIITVAAHGQATQAPSLNIGDPAPPLRVRAWLKGTPVDRFEKGKMYVVEFWATWCKPCIAAMPHLSALAGKYKDKITILGIDIHEEKNPSIAKIKAFVDSLGQRMDYSVAAEDSNFMSVAWMDALGEPGIPRSFVINAEGRVAWTGHPEMLGEVLPAIVKNTWDIKEALAKRNLDKYLEALDRELVHQMLPYVENQFIPNHPFRPDTVLLLINELIAKEPKLKYAPSVAGYTFSALLNTDLQKAYEYGKAVIVTPTYDEPSWYSIIGAVELYADKLNLPPAIYLLGAEAWQARIDHLFYPELVKLPRMYKNMAGFYWRANDKSKAIDALQKAIEVLKNRKDFSATEMAELESRLQQYKAI